MITTHFSPADIAYECNEIRLNGEEPVIYTSEQNAINFINDIILPLILKESETINEDDYNNGYIGKYKGTPVYVTKTVGDLYVIVPQCKED